MNALEQRTTALKRANEIRLTKARFKREVHQQPRQEAMRRVIACIIEWDPFVASFTLRELLGCVRGFGPHSARKLAVLLEASVDDRIDDLTDDQLDGLIHALRDPRLFLPYSGTWRNGARRP